VNDEVTLIFITYSDRNQHYYVGCQYRTVLPYNADMYRGGGGIPRDSEYGYSKDFRCPPVGHFQLNPPPATSGKTAATPSPDDVTDLALLRRKFRVRFFYLSSSFISFLKAF